MKRRSSKRITPATPSPPLKHAKQEHHPLEGHQQEIQSPLPYAIPEQALKTLIEEITADDGEVLPIFIYWEVRKTLKRLTKNTDKNYLGKFVEATVFTDNLQDQKQSFLAAVTRACDEYATLEDKQALVSHSIFWTVPSSKSQPTLRITEPKSQERAVELSWNAEFIGHLPLIALEAHVREQMKLVETYARYSSIVQSSGMGKSRLLNEFSKKHFLIPVNLRPKDDRGYPPADHAVRKFLADIDNDVDMDSLSYIRAQHFLNALFRVTLDTVAGFGASSRAERVQRFYEFMSDGQTMNSSGLKRSQFYEDVVSMAKSGMTGPDLTGDKLKDALQHLRDCIDAGESGKRDEGPAEVFIAFDEAHPLTVPFKNGGGSNFVELRRALQTFRTAPLFTFFLSTTGKVSQFTPPRGYDRSNRMNDGELKIPHPFIYLGFDQLMVCRKILDKYKTLDAVTSLDCIAHMGRPLWGTCYDFGDDQVRDGLLHFAIQKLLCRIPMPNEGLSEAQKCAVLSQRLALDINSTLYITTPPNSEEAEKLHNQISNHMRVCQAIGEGIETIRGVAASEPLLSEAASCIMRGGYGFSLPDALIEVLSGFRINPGDRAELLVAALFTHARDLTVLGKSLPKGRVSFSFSVTDLLSSLFCNPSYEIISKAMPSLCHSESTRQTFEQVFDAAMMHFNHFIKPQEQKLLAVDYLLAFISRGAAALGANCQPGVDAVYPFLYGGTDLDTKKVGFIMVQVKKNDSSNEESQAKIFRKMDPFDCGLVPESRGLNYPIPVIRLVFALCCKEPGLTQKTYESPSEGALSLGKDGQPRFTSYDFWCSGIAPDIFRAVEEAKGRWTALLDDVDPWRSFYNSVQFPDVLRSQFPACGSKAAHFNSWYAEIPQAD